MKLVQVAAALFAGVGCWLVFRLPVLAMAATVAGSAPLLVRRRPTEVVARDLGETATTVARWIEGVRDYLLTASTLQDALILASHDVRGPHARSFQRFAGALTGAGGYGPAAEDLANDLGSALADKALTALWIGGRDGGDIQTRWACWLRAPRPRPTMPDASKPAWPAPAAWSASSRCCAS